ncbi:MAG TPA: cytochrome P450, partial [Alphaproteobacteria bacterium]|nr:cytochrome P450 [Alphaproteobacteria bacterium]
ARLEAKLRSWSREAIDAFVEPGGGDFVRTVAEPIPARSVLDLLGLPQTDLERVRPWTMMGGDMLAGDLDEVHMKRLGVETQRMSEYLMDHLGATLTTPAAERRGPLAVALARGVEEGRIELPVAVGIAIVLFGAGGESTASLLGSAVRLLAEDPALLEGLRSRPDRIPRFVEEVVRLEPPFKGHYRAVRRACRLAGRELAPGDRLFLAWASANRDADVFERPDELDLERRHPKQHMGFGRGAHFCIGAPLARLEARVVLEELVRRVRRIEPASEAPARHVPSLFVRRLERLELAIAS